MFWWSVIKQIVIIVLIVGGLYLYGMKGLLVGYVMGSWFVLFVNISLVSKYIGYKWWRQLLDILPVLVTSVIAALISYGCSHLLGLKMYPDGIVRFLVFLAVYLGWSFIFKPEAFTYTLSILPMKRLKRKEKDK